MNELQQYIFFNGLSINENPVIYQERKSSCGKYRNTKTNKYRTVRDRVNTLEDALGIDVVPRYKHASKTLKNAL